MPNSDAANGGGDTASPDEYCRTCGRKRADHDERVVRHGVCSKFLSEPALNKRMTREIYFAGGDAAFNEVADVLEAAGIMAYARHFRSRVKRPVPSNEGAGS